MKKMNILKIALTLILAFVITGLFAQSTDVEGTAADYDETVTTTYMMEGTTVPLYAEPDAYFHPSYDPDTPGSLTAGFTWDWTEATTTLTFSQTGQEDNYVRLTAPALSAGSYTVNVIENAPAAWGGCNDGTGTNLTVNVVAQPTAALSTTGTITACAGAAALAVTPINATISDGWQNYRLVWTLEIKTLNADGTDKDFYDTDKTTNGTPLAEEYTTAVPDAVAAAGAHDITSVAGGFTVIDASSTVYTYTLTSINDQASRFGEFITLGGAGGTPANFTYYNIGESLVITVNPAPTTGPIYHIDHTWAQ